MNHKIDKIWLFTDGACSGNPGPGGYGCVLVLPSGQVKEWGFGAAQTTNNQMELQAVISGLDFLLGGRPLSNGQAMSGNDLFLDQKTLWILTDSTYVIRGATQWIWGWKKKNWITSEGHAVANLEEWKKLNLLLAQYPGKIEWKYVRGHSQIPGNERCDEIAVAFSKQQPLRLFTGNLSDYSVPVFDLPPDLSLPPIHSNFGDKKNKKKALCYLSYVDGKLERHDTWSECEARVKGRSGAKFKKAMSEAEIDNIKKSWGVNSY